MKRNIAAVVCALMLGSSMAAYAVTCCDLIAGTNPAGGGVCSDHFLGPSCTDDGAGSDDTCPCGVTRTQFQDNCGTGAYSAIQWSWAPSLGGPDYQCNQVQCVHNGQINSFFRYGTNGKSCGG